MASPEALLLRHRVHTTNICMKVIRSAQCRLFKIGHCASIFWSIFTTHEGLTGARLNELQFHNGILHATRSSDRRHGNFRQVSLAG